MPFLNFNETYADSNSTNGELTFVKMSLTFSLKGKKGSGSRNQIIYYDLCIVINHNPKKHFSLIATLFHLYIIDKMDKVEESEVGQICMSSRIVRNLWCTFSLMQLVESSRSIQK